MITYDIKKKVLHFGHDGAEYFVRIKQQQGQAFIATKKKLTSYTDI